MLVGSIPNSPERLDPGWHHYNPPKVVHNEIRPSPVENVPKYAGETHTIMFGLAVERGDLIRSAHIV